MSTEESPCKADARAILRLMRDIALDGEHMTTNRIAAAAVYLDYWPWLNPAQEGAEEVEITPSSGNVFADLGFDDPDAELARAEVAIAAMQAEQRTTLGGIDPATFVVS